MRRRSRQPITVIAATVALTACAAGGAQATTIPGAPGGPGDMTASSSATITFGGPPNAYSPDQLAVGRSGAGLAQVTWEGSFLSHPLRFEDLGVPGKDGSDPSTSRSLGSGRFAYFCAVHRSGGMTGTLYVAGPRASLRSVPADVAPGGTVTLDAGASDLVRYASSPDARSYAFDPEGDGTFLAASGASSMQATYPAQGTVTARVRVTEDATGRVDEAAFDIDVAPPGTTPPPPADPPGDPAPGSPTGTTGPGTDGTGSPRRAARFADVATLPVFGRCVDRRRGVRIRVRDASGADVRRVRVLVNGRAVRSRRVQRSATLTIRPLPRGRPLVKVVVTLAGGRQLARTTRYRVCAG